MEEKIGWNNLYRKTDAGSDADQPVYKKFGLELDREDAELLVQERKNSLRERQRVEFGEGILKSWFFIFATPRLSCRKTMRIH